MRGVVFLGDRELDLMSFPDPTPGAGEVVLEMKASGMCGSDLKQYRRQRGVRQNNGLATPEGPTIVHYAHAGKPLHVNLHVGTVMALADTATGRTCCAFQPVTAWQAQWEAAAANVVLGAHRTEDRRPTRKLRESAAGSRQNMDC